MTRGKIAIIADDYKIISSIEFNGEMYPEKPGRGLDVIRDLKKVNTKEAFYKLVNKFNEDNFQYEDEELTFEVDDSFFDMSNDYFDKWFSDYVYIKNLTKKDLTFTLDCEKTIDIKPNEIMVFNFGSLWLEDTQQQARLKLISDLQSIKEKLSFIDMSKHYSDIYNACVDYDNAYHDLNLTDYICEENYMSDDDIELYIENEKPSIDRLRYFIGDTYSADLYQMDGYGNLRNIDTEDLSNLIDELITTTHNVVVEDLNIERKKQKNKEEIL